MIPASIVAVLSVATVGWLSLAAIAPQGAQAYTARIEVSLTRQSSESYENLLRRAEAVARAAAQRGFDGDILVTEVSVTITGQNAGAIAPILLLEVSRSNWKRRPDPQLWATYFPNTKFLLGFAEFDTEAETPSASPSPEPPSPPAAAPPPSDSPSTPESPSPPESPSQEDDPGFRDD
ncbi:MAG: hypothetical protein F6K47_18620 [Symploca sp. SIO2E6]|nr:hypothetical protein [Symploca sp. SIO2E6]